MTTFQVDLTNCDREPIHIPGQVQSHGFLVVVDESERIRFFSDNIVTYLTLDTGVLLGAPLKLVEYIINPEQPDFIRTLIRFGQANKNFDQTNPFQLEIGGNPFFLIISSSAQYILLEFEPAAHQLMQDVQKMVGRSVSQMLADKNLQNLLDNTAMQVKNIISYDRVMIYRFAEDGHGEVMAEAKNNDLESWLGLHYPASDIPKQARELYKVNLTRLIADVNTIPSRISTSAGQPEPLDLTYSQLRAVSPIHIQYLKNMGVASSFSISLIYKKELWGLVACHNYTPRFIDYRSRESAKLIGQILSSALEFRQDEENQQISDLFKESLDQLTKYLMRDSSIAYALTGKETTLLNVTHASGAVLIYEKQFHKLGTTPNETQLQNLLNWIKENIKENSYHASNLSSIYPDAANFAGIGSGLMVSVLSRELEEYMIWFKPEQLQTITWAGNPDKPVEINAAGLANISPRHSFEAWKQTVTGTSENWRIEEINSAIRLKEEVIYALNLKAGAIRLLNEKLRLAYEELDTFSYTISHDLKNPIFTIKSYAQLVSRAETFGGKERDMLGRIIERADKMNFMINEVLDYSRIGRSEVNFRPVNTGNLITDIIKDLELIYDVNTVTITMGDTPDLMGDPLMLLQVFTNIIGNAVKYSQKSVKPIVHIEGKVENATVCYSIKDNGLGIPPNELPKIFELFNRMSNVGEIEGSGVGLAIVKRIIEKHKGKIWVESELGKGSTFYVVFKH